MLFQVRITNPFTICLQTKLFNKKMKGIQMDGMGDTLSVGRVLELYGRDDLQLINCI